MSKLTPVAHIWLHSDGSIASEIATNNNVALTAVFTEAQLNQSRADALREAATMCEENHGTASLTAKKLRRMSAEIEKGSEK